MGMSEAESAQNLPIFPEALGKPTRKLVPRCTRRKVDLVQAPRRTRSPKESSPGTAKPRRRRGSSPEPAALRRSPQREGSDRSDSHRPPINGERRSLSLAARMLALPGPKSPRTHGALQSPPADPGKFRRRALPRAQNLPILLDPPKLTQKLTPSLHAPKGVVTPVVANVPIGERSVALKSERPPF